MGRVPKLKLSFKAPSAHSRAARRATSPSIDTDKSLKNAKPPATGSTAPLSPPSAAAAAAVPTIPLHRSTRVAKHRGEAQIRAQFEARQRPISRSQRKRQERGQQRAAAVREQTERKVARSATRGRKIRERRGAWDDINIKLRLPVKVGRKGEGEGEGEGGQENAMEGVEAQGGEAADSGDEIAEQVTQLRMGETGAGGATATDAAATGTAGLQFGEQIEEDVVT